MDPLIQKAEDEIFAVMRAEVAAAKLLYVENLGYRIFLKSGSSIGICTNKTWKNEKTKPHISKLTSEFYANELLRMKRNNHTVSIRVQGQSYCKFMQAISKHGLGNVIVICKFFDDKIVAYYFVSNGDNPNIPSNFANDKPIFDSIVNNIHAKIERIVQRYNLSSYGTQLFPEHVTGELFPSFKRKQRLVHDMEQEFSFTEKQKEIMMLLASGCIRGKEIADKASITLRTVDWHIHELKSKIHINTKTELVNYAKRIAIAG